MDTAKRRVDSTRAMSVVKIAGPNCWLATSGTL